jgi:hypothetical protein
LQGHWPLRIITEFRATCSWPWQQLLLLDHDKQSWTLLPCMPLATSSCRDNEHCYHACPWLLAVAVTNSHEHSYNACPWLLAVVLTNSHEHCYLALILGPRTDSNECYYHVSAGYMPLTLTKNHEGRYNPSTWLTWLYTLTNSHEYCHHAFTWLLEVDPNWQSWTLLPCFVPLISPETGQLWHNVRVLWDLYSSIRNTC